ncbi:DUF1294 domain-containing protein [Gallaecimonas mangrovi]|uniref:DUF1294 domain-containing protein n=1 Tax=Gallaecimonas mangrovi TaxID=2291597 RepID=UPI000E203C34|nr:cold shock and DUF1294 domain-containing protein [Gallaecimonas mangrovi]
MRYLGRLQNWNDDKGFGFVEPNGGGVRAFVHIKAFEQRRQRPGNGDLINYVLGKDQQGRPQALAIRFANKAANTPRQHAQSGGASALFGLVFLAMVLALSFFKKMPLPFTAAYWGLSLFVFLLYGADKSAAQKGRWRTKESTLHLFALLGGWPGGALAQYIFRHKSKKKAFKAVFWLTVFINIAALCWLEWQLVS